MGKCVQVGVTGGVCGAKGKCVNAAATKNAAAKRPAKSTPEPVQPAPASSSLPYISLGVGVVLGGVAGVLAAIASTRETTLMDDVNPDPLLPSAPHAHDCGAAMTDPGPWQKLRPTAADALADLRDGAAIMVGGFGLCGNAEALIEAVLHTGARDLTIISNNAGNLGKGLATWLRAGIVAKVVCTYIGNNEDLHRLMADGSLDVELNPQGTFVERMRAAGAGIPAFFTPTGAGTVVAQGKETRIFNGRPCLLETALFADYALIRADRADPYGNVRFRATTRNFAPVMATAARTTIVECDHLEALGGIGPDDIHLPGVFVDRIVHVPDHEDPFEYRMSRPRPASAPAAQGTS